jgi:hypothetical protein
VSGGNQVSEPAPDLDSRPDAIQLIFHVALSEENASVLQEDNRPPRDVLVALREFPLHPEPKREAETGWTHSGHGAMLRRHIPEFVEKL